MPFRSIRRLLQRRGFGQSWAIWVIARQVIRIRASTTPTSAAMAEAIAELHGAEAGFAFRHGMAAAHGMFVALLKAGDHVVASSALHGSVPSTCSRTARVASASSTFVITDLAAVDGVFKPNTRVLHVETIANPTIVVAYLPALAEIAHRHGAGADGRQHVRIALPVPAARAGRRPCLRVMHQVGSAGTPTCSVGSSSAMRP